MIAQVRAVKGNVDLLVKIAHFGPPGTPGTRRDARCGRMGAYARLRSPGCSPGRLDRREPAVPRRTPASLFGGTDTPEREL